MGIQIKAAEKEIQRRVPVWAKIVNSGIIAIN
jgi:hypothetical protein